jgi:hypothetical protein
MILIGNKVITASVKEILERIQYETRLKGDPYLKDIRPTGHTCMVTCPVHKNHSENHPDMTTLAKEKQKEEIMKVHNRVKELTGYEMELFRPPFGAYNNDVIRTCYENNYYPVQWNVDSLDWQDYDAATIISNVCEHKALGPGAIILCHNGALHTAEALDEMLTNLKEQGYTLVPLKLYFKGSLVKMEIALCKGKHTYDKKQSIAERDLKRSTDREIKNAGF